jgi:hypothetical protein
VRIVSSITGLRASAEVATDGIYSSGTKWSVPPDFLDYDFTTIQLLCLRALTNFVQTASPNEIVNFTELIFSSHGVTPLYYSVWGLIAASPKRYREILYFLLRVYSRNVPRQHRSALPFGYSEKNRRLSWSLKSCVRWRRTCSLDCLLNLRKIIPCSFVRCIPRGKILTQDYVRGKCAEGGVRI